MTPEERIAAAPRADATNPAHYKAHPSGVECITITRHMGFSLGNAVKYIWRAGLKNEDPVADLRKAVWYLEDEINRIERERASPPKYDVTIKTGEMRVK